jgi:hypothetical protein
MLTKIIEKITYIYGIIFFIRFVMRYIYFLQYIYLMS